MEIVKNKNEVKKAVSMLYRQLNKNIKCEEIKNITVGHQGSSDKYNILWHPKESIWTFLNLKLKGHENRYWFAIGTEKPEENSSRSMNISCEINSPIEGIDRRMAGLILKDSKNKYYLAHTGKIGGGRKGVGKKNFTLYMNRYGPKSIDIQEVEFSSNRFEDVFILGELNKKNIVNNISIFAKSVASFKKTKK